MPSGSLRALIAAVRPWAQMLQFFMQRPVLARLVGTIVAQWQATTGAFLSHLHNDWVDLETVLLGGTQHGLVARISTEVADRHRGGAHVFVVELADGTRVVYKPRSLAIDRAWHECVEWLNARGASLVAPRVLSFPDHGWAEYIASSPCTNDHEVREYYSSCGQLLCITQLLNSSDLHSDNMISAGPNPVIVDLETLLTPLYREPAWESEGEQLARRFLDTSVAKNSLIACRIPATREKSVSIAAVSPPERTQQWAWTWSNVSSDQMSFERSETPVAPRGPMWGDTFCDPRNYVDEILRGYLRLGELVLQHREALLTGPLSAFEGVPVRVTVRSTGLYFDTRWNMDLPLNLRHGVDWSIPTFRHWRSRNWSKDMAVVLKSERQAYAELDIPYFWVSSESCTLSDARNGPLVEKFFEEAPFAVARRLVAEFNADVLFEQMALVKEVLLFSHETGLSTARDVRQEEQWPRRAGAALERIADTLVSSAWVKADSAAWLFCSTPDTGEYLELATDDLYGGAPGIAVAFAQMHAGARGGPFDVWARRALVGARQRARSNRPTGGLTGRGSLIRALSIVGRSLGDESIVREAIGLALEVRPEDIVDDAELDVISGCAGLLLNLLRLREDTNDDRLLVPAEQCGERLLETQTRDGGWLVPGFTSPLSGFSHGAAGIALALLWLHGTTNDSRFKAAYLRAIEFERRLFDANTGLWHQSCDDALARCDWCHGALGIGLARMAGLRWDHTTEARQEIDAAVAATLAAPPSVAHHLCCGEAGRIDFLVYASTKLGRPELRDAAVLRTDAMLESAHTQGGFRLNRSGPAHRQLGLFSGITGIGYALQRLLDPDRTPCLLTWDA